MTSLFVGLGCFLLHASVSLVWLRLPGRMSPVARHAVSAIGTHLFGVIAAAQFVGPFGYWPVAAVSGFAAVCWLFAFSAVYKSVSLRILTQLDRTPGHALLFEVVTEEYVRPEFEARVAVLMKMGCAEETADGYAATAKGNDTARRIEAVQRACGIEASGMYGEAANPERERRGVCRPHSVAHAPGSPESVTPPVP